MGRRIVVDIGQCLQSMYMRMDHPSYMSWKLAPWLFGSTTKYDV